nr:helix-turn-helix domain-containing protein [Pseudomonas canadensis]
MDQRIKLVIDWLSGDFTKSQLARRFGVSRPTVDKWISRHVEGDLKSLAGVSRRPHTSPNKTDDEILARIVAMKEAHNKWGPKKLVELLRIDDPSVAWPSPSTAGQWLDRLGLVNKRRFKRRHSSVHRVMREANEPNKTWCADYKGQFKMLNAQMCYPLTVTDHASRLILACRAHPKIMTQPVKQAFERLFQEYGCRKSFALTTAFPLLLQAWQECPRWQFGGSAWVYIPNEPCRDDLPKMAAMKGCIAV